MFRARVGQGERGGRREAARARLRARAAALVLLSLASACAETAAGSGGSAGPKTAAAPEDPVDFGTLGSFSLIDQDGRTLTQADFAGRPWVAACIFTLCTGPCPSITRQMAYVVGELDGVDARFLSLSVDPARDKPFMLKRYAESFGADLERWSFATGEEVAIDALVRQGFRLPLARLPEPDPATGTELTHDQRFVVVDGTGRIRGWYDSQDPEEVQRLIERVKVLARERSPGQ